MILEDLMHDHSVNHKLGGLELHEELMVQCADLLPDLTVEKLWELLQEMRRNRTDICQLDRQGLDRELAIDAVISVACRMPTDQLVDALKTLKRIESLNL